MLHGRSARVVVLNVALAVLYVLVARLGLMLDAVSGFATLVWPATGVSVVALIVFGYRLWPGIAAGALITNLSVGAPLAVASGIALGNTLEALAGAWAVKRATGGYPSLGRVRDMLAFIGLVAVASTLISATLGVMSLRLGGIVDATGWPDTWRAWWIGDLMGDLIVGPILLLPWAWAEAIRKAGRRGIFEAAALGLLLLAVNTLVFGARDGGAASLIREAYLAFPLLVLGAIRFGVRGAAAGNFIVSLVAVTGTVLGRGPFNMGSLSNGLLHLQVFMIVVVATTLVLGATSEERRQAIGLRDSLISLASHELRTPLTALQLRIQLLARNARASQPSQERLSRDAIGAEEQVKRLARLVDDLLDISRIMSGRIRLDLEEIDLDRFVREIVDRCPEPQRELVSIRSGGEPVVGHWDRMRIDQIVSNLLSNALKYGENKPIEIVLSRSDERARAHLEVRDHGVGIAAADLPRIFERFERAAAKPVG
ncbi:MAG TPA: MASE1 domain-containing protein, partial [Polyangiaceae bacterium]|nr:MASE1 domain-containing protein [Polyangiaceae bacterium]